MEKESEKDPDVILFFQSIIKEDYETMKTLLEKGAVRLDKEYYHEDYCHCFIIFAQFALGRHPEKPFYFLIEEGTNVNYIDRDTFLQTSIFFERWEVVEFLLNKKADPNLKGYGLEDYPLITALYKKSDVIFELLLEAGADPNVTDWKGRSALKIASKKGSYYRVKSLLTYGAEPGDREFLKHFNSIERRSLERLCNKNIKSAKRDE